MQRDLGAVLGADDGGMWHPVGGADESAYGNDDDGGVIVMSCNAGRGASTPPAASFLDLQDRSASAQLVITLAHRY